MDKRFCGKHYAISTVSGIRNAEENGIFVLNYLAHARALDTKLRDEKLSNVPDVADFVAVLRRGVSRK